MEPSFFDHFKRQNVHCGATLKHVSDESSTGCRCSLNGCIRHVMSVPYHEFLHVFTRTLFTMQKVLVCVTGLTETFWIELKEVEENTSCERGRNCSCRSCSSTCTMHLNTSNMIESKPSIVGIFHPLYLIQDIQTLHFSVPSKRKDHTYTTVKNLITNIRRIHGNVNETALFAKHGVFKANASDFFNEVTFVDIKKPNCLNVELLFTNVSDICINGTPHMSKLVVHPLTNGNSWSCIVIEDLSDKHKKYCFNLMKNAKRFSEAHVDAMGKLGYFSFLCYLHIRLTHQMHQSFRALVMSNETDENRQEMQNLTKEAFRSGFNEARRSKINSTLRFITKARKGNRCINLKKINNKLATLRMSELTSNGSWEAVRINQCFENCSTFIRDLKRISYEASMKNLILLVEIHMLSKR